MYGFLSKDTSRTPDWIKKVKKHAETQKEFIELYTDKCKQKSVSSLFYWVYVLNVPPFKMQKTPSQRPETFKRTYLGLPLRLMRLLESLGNATSLIEKSWTAPGYYISTLIFNHG
jgi:hypothetical protein